MTIVINPYTGLPDEVGSSGGGTWGSITGTLSNQTDLQTALNLKANAASYVPYTGATTGLDLGYQTLIAGGDTLIQKTGASTTDAICNLVLRSVNLGNFDWRIQNDRSTLFLRIAYTNTGSYTDRLTLSPTGDLTVTGSISYGGNLSIGNTSILGLNSSSLQLYNGSDGNLYITASAFNSSLSRIRFRTASPATLRMTIDENGNVAVGSSLAVSRFHVYNSAAATIAEIIQGASSQSANLTEWRDSAGTALGNMNASGVLSPTALRIGLGGANIAPYMFAFDGISLSTPTTSGRGFSFFSYMNTSPSISLAFTGDATTMTSGTNTHAQFSRLFAPTSGTGVFSLLAALPTINQTGGANGITRGLFINPTLTAAADFRALEITNSTGIAINCTGTARSVFAGDVIEASHTRVASDFAVTSNTTLANITGLTYNVEAGATYTFRATLFTTSNSAGGIKAAIAGTCTATSIIYEGYALEGTAILGSTRANALATAVVGITTATTATIEIEGTITVNAAGTLTVQFAQNASNVSASTVLRGSVFMLKRLN